jgi:RNA polymerase sigma-70 factor (ECF subfamily)
MEKVKRNGNGKVHAAHGRDASSDRAHKHNGGVAVEAHARPASLLGTSSPPEVRTDEQLLLAYQQGDKPSFRLLMERYQRELFHFLVRFLGDRAAAEDVFQETFLQVHQSADQFDTSRRFRPWLFTIAANKARDLIRSQARRPTNPLQASINPGDDESGEFMDLMSSNDAFPDEGLQKAELQQQVQKTVLGMPQHLREILLLSYFHQFPYKQISDILEIPLGTVKSRLHAAVAHFADRWKSTNHHRTVP